jgi:hypothetical protein
MITRSFNPTSTVVDVASSLLSYGATLQRRCQRAHGWDSALASRVFVSYSQFLDLKVILEDIDAKYLSPSFLVDQMWHQHLLDNRHYERFCHSVCNGRQIYHDPEGGDDVMTRQMRVEQTQSALKNRFDEAIDRMVWEMGTASTIGGTSKQQDIKKRKRSKRFSTILVSKRLALTPTQRVDIVEMENVKEEEELSLTVWLEVPSRASQSKQPQATEFKLVLPSRTRTRMAYVYKLCARQMGISSSGDLLLSYADHGGHQIRAKRRGYFDFGPIERGEARFVCTYNPRPVTIRIVDHNDNAENLFDCSPAKVIALERSSKVQDLYQAYSHACGMQVGSFELRCQGRKLLESNTPRSLQWFDHVEVEYQRCMENDVVLTVECQENVADLGKSGFGTIHNDGDDDASIATTWEDHASLSTNSLPDSNKSPSSTVKVRHQTGDEYSYQIQEKTPMQSIFLAQAEALGVKGSDLRFLLDGEHINAHETPGVLELIEGDTIDSMLAGMAC